MSARKKETKINLLPEKGFASSTTGRILAWILSSFRVIVITTEIIVMIAFLSRFWLDAQNTDLSDEIKEKRAALEAAQPFEKEFIDKQNRLLLYKALEDQKITYSGLIKDVGDYLPQDSLLAEIDFEDAGAIITGITPNELGIQQYIVNLQSSQNFSKIGLAGIKTLEENTNFLQYTINAEYKQK